MSVKKTAAPASADAGTTTTKRRVAAKKPAAKSASSVAAAKASTSEIQGSVDVLDAPESVDAAAPGETEEAKPETTEGGTSTGFVYSDADDDDAPAQQVVSAGATADPVKDYLKQIGKVALLNAEQEVDLALRIEAGLFAEDKLQHSTGL